MDIEVDSVFKGIIFNFNIISGSQLMSPKWILLLRYCNTHCVLISGALCVLYFLLSPTYIHMHAYVLVYIRPSVRLSVCYVEDNKTGNLGITQYCGPFCNHCSGGKAKCIT